MRCTECPFDSDATCGRDGCRARLAEGRVATFVGSGRAALLDVAREALGLAPLTRPAAPAFDGVEAQLTRLDVESGDLLVMRTRNRLQPGTAAKWQDQLVALCRAQGVRDVTVIVLDDCTDLAIERPATRMAQQRREAPQPMSC